MAFVRQKFGVTHAKLAPAGYKILWAVQTAADALGLDLTVTSGDEGSWRSPTDPHTTGEAVDLSVAGMDDVTIIALYKAFGRMLPAHQFTVLFEVPAAHRVDLTLSVALRDIAYWNAKATGRHFHIQRKKGTKYAPATGIGVPTLDV